MLSVHLVFSVQTLVFISECGELIIITAEKPVLVSCVQKDSPLYVLPQHFTLALDAFQVSFDCA